MTPTEELLTKERDEALRRAKSAEELLKAKHAEYEPELDKCEEEAERCKAEGDMVGWNFHMGKWHGIVFGDIMYGNAVKSCPIDDFRELLERVIFDAEQNCKPDSRGFQRGDGKVEKIWKERLASYRKVENWFNKFFR